MFSCFNKRNEVFVIRLFSAIAEILCEEKGKNFDICNGMLTYLFLKAGRRRYQQQKKKEDKII